MTRWGTVGALRREGSADAFRLWLEVAKAFKTSWESVFRSVEMVVEWGLTHRRLDGVKSIGVDEVLWPETRPL